ncbi:hypothetical protein ACQEUX_21920 [Micromonospora sp. CA-259024]|uniref:hypothetical protein n=1 Tax=Micromonospora sp. CA-259024 TaxID=3239965 RepID=UPI003D8A3155
MVEHPSPDAARRTAVDSVAVREFPGDPAGRALRIAAAVRPGTIVFGHDVVARRRLIARGPTDMINGLRARGVIFVTVSALLRAGVGPDPTG